MQQFRIRPDAFGALRKKVLMRSIPIMLIAASAGAIIPLINSKEKASDTSFLFFFIPIIIGVMGFSIWNALKKQQKLLESYLLTIDGNVITREQLNTEEITIYFHEVKEIVRGNQGSLAIKGFDKTEIIYVPIHIERYGELEALLGEIKPITAPSTSASLLQKLSPLLSLVGIALMLTVYMASNKIVVGIAGTLCIALLCYSIYEVRRSKNIDKRTKNRIWIVLIVMASILFSMGMKLIAPDGSF
jgi:hypothetical protein